MGESTNSIGDNYFTQKLLQQAKIATDQKSKTYSFCLTNSWWLLSNCRTEYQTNLVLKAAVISRFLSFSVEIHVI